MINLDEKLTALRSSQTTRFVDLARISELDPGDDFKLADLRNSDFSGQDLRDFDFSYSLLQGSKFKGAIFNSETLSNAHFFHWEVAFELSPSERFAANWSRLAPRYYQRISATVALAISRPSRVISEVLRDTIAYDASKYHVSFARNVNDAITKDESNAVARKIHVAQLALRQTYPLDRQRYYSSLREMKKLFPMLSSYFPNI